MKTGSEPKSGGIHIHILPSTLQAAAALLPLGLLVGYLWGRSAAPDPGQPPMPPSSPPRSESPLSSPLPTAPAPGGGATPLAANVTEDSPGERERVYKGNPGPWGNLEYTRIAIERPDELMDPDFPTSYQTSWFFAERTAADLATLFSQPDLTEAQQQRLLEKARWQKAEAGIFVVPGHDLILGLGPEARLRLYTVLAESPTNLWHFPAFAWRQDLIAQWFDQSGLSPVTLEKAKRLLYPRGGSLCFSDPVALSNSLRTHEEKVRLWKTLSRQATVLAKLRITPGANVDALVRYWSRAGRAKDIRPLLESLARAPGGATVDVAHLMSPFARRLLYTYAFPPTDARPAPYNCTYTALNYFSEQPDERMCDMGEARRVLETDYYPLPSNDPAYGDIIAIYDRQDHLLHTVVYIADELVFTKNGAHFQQPWLLMDFSDMLAMYPSEQPLRTVAYRRKDS